MSHLTEDEAKEREREDRRRLSRQQIIEHVKKSLLYTAFDVKWIPHSASFVVVGQYPNNNGAAAIYELSHGELRSQCDSRREFPLKCCTFSHNSPNYTTGLSLCTGDFAGGVSLWDVERLSDRQTAPLFSAPHAHSSIVNAVDGARFCGPPEVVSCGRDGFVKVWDTRQSTAPVAALCPKDPQRARDCWAARFGNSHDADERVVAAGYDNGDVKLFDLRTQRILHEFNVGNGVCDVEFDRPDIEMNKIIVASLEGRVRVYDVRTLHPKLGYAFVEERVATGTVWCARALPQNREVFVCGGGGELSLCRYQYPPDRQLRDADGVAKGVAGSVEELNRVRVGDQPIHAVDWNRQKEGLLACASFDQSVRVMLVTKLSLLR